MLVRIQPHPLIRKALTTNNKKEIFYRLTEQGKIACENFYRFTENMNHPIREYLAGLDETSRNHVEGLFDHIMTEIAKGKECYIKCLSKVKNYLKKIGI